MDKVIFVDEDLNAIEHYGILRRSGRYPWGSGDNAETPADRSKSFLDWLKSMLGQGLTEQQVAEGVGMTTTQLRETKSIAIAEKKAADVAFAQRLKDKQYSNVAIAKRMGIGESQVRNLLKPGADDKSVILNTVTNALRDNVDKKEFLDVGKGVETQLDISKEKLTQALAILQDEGYEVHKVKVPQLGNPGKETTFKVLCKEGVTQKEAWLNRDRIQQLSDVYSNDGGRTAANIVPPLSLDPDRVAINYAEYDAKGNPTLGGAQADGVLYIRPGVEDVSIGANQYAQVRVKVGDGHYLKGMAVYKDDLPDGVDVVFNTNKTRDKNPNKLDVMKKLEDDPENPFGSSIKRQLKDEDHFAKTGEEKLTSTMNILYEEGDWDNWSRTLSSQMLSKQHTKLAKQQLDELYQRKQSELDEIMALDNPVVKRMLLEKFSDSADGAAIHLKAAGMPGQSTHVLMPVPKMKPTEIYAPNFENGERVVLIRHPHGGVFEIPELTVNNRQPDAKKLLGSGKDAVGINPKVAEQLSGADFDGDTVLVIPNSRGQIKTAPVLKQLEGFDPKAAYPKFDGMPIMKNKQTQMGMISNLITDMTILGAKQDEIARAVKHSMVVIDAEKHELNYKQSAKDNGIAQLREKYLGKADKGATTIVSRAGGKKYIPELREARIGEGGRINPETGERNYVPTGKKTRRGTDKLVKVKNLSPEAAAAEGVKDDAYRLVSDSSTPVEKIYANHSNRMKAMANTARKESLSVKDIPYNPSARRVYKKEVDSLESKYAIALRNKPKERQAQVVGDTLYRARLRDNPDMDDDQKKKVKRQSMATARHRVGADRQRIQFTEKEWEAVQAGAVSKTRLKKYFEESDLDQIKELATPRSSLKMTPAKISRARTMAARGYTQAEIAAQLGVGLTTLKEGLK